MSSTLRVAAFALVLVASHLLSSSCAHSASDGTDSIAGLDLVGDREGEPEIFLDGHPFPPLRSYELDEPRSTHTLYVAAGGKSEGTGTQDSPWHDLRQALSRLRPGDRLQLLPGEYVGAFEIKRQEGCVPGSAERPIEVVGGADVVFKGSVRLGLSHWRLIDMEIVPTSDRYPAVLVGGEPGLADIVLHRLHLHSGRRAGIILNSARDVTISSSHIHDFWRVDERGQAQDAHGILIGLGSSQITILGNEIHGNSGDSVQVYGPGKPFPQERRVTDVTVVGNRMYGDRENAVDIKDALGVTISDNRIWDYRPSQTSNGVGITIHFDADDVVVQNNFLADVVTGVHISRGRPIGDPSLIEKPNNVLVIGNYIEGRKGGSAAGISIVEAECIEIYHNIVSGFRSGFYSPVNPPGNQQLYVANNIFIEPSEVGFWIGSNRSAFNLFDFNAFASTSRTVKGRVSNKVRELSDHIGPGKMFPQTMVRGAVRLEGGDLARVEGLETVDRGVAVNRECRREGAPQAIRFHGEAPDLGVAEAGSAGAPRRYDQGLDPSSRGETSSQRLVGSETGNR